MNHCIAWRWRFSVFVKRHVRANKRVLEPFELLDLDCVALDEMEVGLYIWLEATRGIPLEHDHAR